MRTSAVALTLLTIAACAGSPSGPGPGADGPSGSIYISWRMPDTLVDTDIQIYRVSPSDGHYEEVATPFYTVNPDFDVDVDGSGLLLVPPRASFAWMPGFDTSRIVVPSLRSIRLSPRISPDLGSIATIVSEQFIPREIRIFSLRTGHERSIGLAANSGGQINHWFAGGDSLLVSWTGALGERNYYIAQTDGSGITPFNFPLARHASYLRISRDEARLAISQPRGSDSLYAYSDTIQIVALSPPHLESSIGLPYPAGPIAWSPDGRYLAHMKGGVYNGDDYLEFPVLEIIDVATGQRTPLVMDRPPGSFPWDVHWARK